MGDLAITIPIRHEDANDSFRRNAVLDSEQNQRASFDDVRLFSGLCSLRKSRKALIYSQNPCSIQVNKWTLNVGSIGLKTQSFNCSGNTAF
jgi:hypothetical protein